MNQQLFEQLPVVLSDRFGHLAWDWDDGVPEGWGMLMDNDRACAIVCRLSPFAMLIGVKPFAQELGEKLAELGWLCVTAPSWEEPFFRADVEVLARLFPDCPVITHRSPSVDWERFSANELWWATIS